MLTENIKADGSQAIGWVTEDVEGNKLAFYLPKTKFKDGKANIEGKDTDVMVAGSMQAILDTDTGHQIIVDLFLA